MAINVANTQTNQIAPIISRSDFYQLQKLALVVFVLFCGGKRGHEGKLQKANGQTVAKSGTATGDSGLGNDAHLGQTEAIWYSRIHRPSPLVLSWE